MHVQSVDVRSADHGVHATTWPEKLLWRASFFGLAFFRGLLLRKKEGKWCN
jgi:hypothetical protein